MTIRQSPEEVLSVRANLPVSFTHNARTCSVPSTVPEAEEYSWQVPYLFSRDACNLLKISLFNSDKMHDVVRWSSFTVGLSPYHILAERGKTVAHKTFLRLGGHPHLCNIFLSSISKSTLKSKTPWNFFHSTLEI